MATSGKNGIVVLKFDSGTTTYSTLASDVQSLEGPTPNSEADALPILRLPQVFSFTVNSTFEEGAFDAMRQACGFATYDPVTMMFRPGTQWFMPDVTLQNARIESVKEASERAFTLYLRASGRKMTFSHWFARPVFWAWLVWRRIRAWWKALPGGGE